MQKTWAVLDHSVCLAMGKPWLGFPCDSATVLIVDEESGATPEAWSSRPAISPQE
jgi:hypothetical protein